MIPMLRVVPSNFCWIVTFTHYLVRVSEIIPYLKYISHLNVIIYMITDQQDSFIKTAGIQKEKINMDKVFTKE